MLRYHNTTSRYFAERYGLTLDHIFQQKDLEVILDAETQWAYSTKIKRANTIVRLLQRNFSYLDCPLFRKLFSIFVRTLLEYDLVISALHLENILINLKTYKRLATEVVDIKTWALQNDWKGYSVTRLQKRWKWCDWAVQALLQLQRIYLIQKKSKRQCKRCPKELLPLLQSKGLEGWYARQEHQCLKPNLRRKNS